MNHKWLDFQRAVKRACTSFAHQLVSTDVALSTLIMEFNAQIAGLEPRFLNALEFEAVSRDTARVAFVGCLTTIKESILLQEDLEGLLDVLDADCLADFNIAKRGLEAEWRYKNGKD